MTSRYDVVIVGGAVSGSAVAYFPSATRRPLFLSGAATEEDPAVDWDDFELITCGKFRTLDLAEVGYERIVEGRPFLEKAVI